MFHITKSSKSFEETIVNLTKALTDHQFGVLSTIPLSEKFVAKGLPFEGRITILDVCNPLEAYKVYTIDPLAVNFLPCKFIVREDSAGVRVEMIRPTELIELMNNPELTTFAQKIEDVLIEVTKAL